MTDEVKDTQKGSETMTETPKPDDLSLKVAAAYLNQEPMPESKPAEESVPAVPDKPVEKPVVEPPKAEEVNPGEPAKHEEPPKVEEQHPDSGVEWDEDLLVRATNAGVTDAYIEKFLKTPARLESYLSKLTEKKTDVKTVEVEEFPKDLEEDLDPKIVAYLKAEKAERTKLQKKLDALDEQRVKSEKIAVDREKAAELREQAEYFKRADNRFIAIAKEHPELGEGDGATVIKKNSEAYNLRVDVLDTMNTLAASYERRHKSVPDEDSLFKEAVQRVLGGSKNTTATINEKLEKRDGERTSRPNGTAKNTAAPANTLEVAKNYLQSQGFA